MTRSGALKIATATLSVLMVTSLCYGFEISIEVAPRTLNLASEGKLVTVHTDIAYSEVNVAAVFLNGILIDSWKADARGNFVAKFRMNDVKELDGLVIGGANTLILSGVTHAGEAFFGETEIKVIDFKAVRSEGP